MGNFTHQLSKTNKINNLGNLLYRCIKQSEPDRIEKYRLILKKLLIESIREKNTTRTKQIGNILSYNHQVTKLTNKEQLLTKAEEFLHKLDSDIETMSFMIRDT
jgi:hypothetical protein